MPASQTVPACFDTAGNGLRNYKGSNADVHADLDGSRVNKASRLRRPRCVRWLAVKLLRSASLPSTLLMHSGGVGHQCEPSWSYRAALTSQRFPRHHGPGDSW
jgi:hypothetical protein